MGGIRVLLFTLIQGMNQDVSPSKRADKFAYEIKNMRITVEDSNTLMSWSNEKGTEKLKMYNLLDYKQGILTPASIEGKVLGTCLLNDYLILFIKKSFGHDRICGINFKDEDTPLYYMFYDGDLNFDESSKFETIGVYENTAVQKVYWIDGVNLARFINIAGDLDKIYNGLNTLFDFLPTDNESLEVTIEKTYLTGLFPAGTVLYAFSYYNQFGALTNLVYLSPIQYIANYNSGVEADLTVNCAFRIYCSNINPDFDYLRIYSISRASTDTAPQVRIVTDIPIALAEVINDSILISYTDNGQSGSTLDYSALLFMNRLSMIPSTMDLKDNTLFLGNFQYNSNFDIQLKELFSELYVDEVITFTKVPLLSVSKNQFYPLENQLIYSSDKITGFKGGESYIFGFVLLDTTDRWTSIIPLQGILLNTLYPSTEYSETSNSYVSYIVQAEVNPEAVEFIKTYANTCSETIKYKTIKFVIVSTDEAQRSVLCLGIVSPTVFCAETRAKRGIPFALSSWFFRPSMKYNPTHYETEGITAYANNNKGSINEFRHYASLSYLTDSSYTLEILAAGGGESAGYCTLGTLTSENSTCIYGVDTSILTLHSPDIEFDSVVLRMLQNNNVYKFRLVGYTVLHGTYSNSYIELEQSKAFVANGDTPLTLSMNANTGKKINTYNSDCPAAGLNYWYGAYGDSTFRNENGSRGDETSDTVLRTEAYFRIFPWNRSESINIQAQLVSGSGTGANNVEVTAWEFPINTKVMSNIRVCGKTLMGTNYYWRALDSTLDEAERGCSLIQIWQPTSKFEKIFLKDSPLDLDITYLGNIDTVITPLYSGYQLFAYDGDGEKKHNGQESRVPVSTTNSKEMIRMKYNSTEHAVFSLGYKQSNSSQVLWILPLLSNKGSVSSSVTIPVSGSATAPWEVEQSLSASKTVININVLNVVDLIDDDTKTCKISTPPSTSALKKVFNLATKKGKLTVTNSNVQQLLVVTGKSRYLANTNSNARTFYFAEHNLVSDTYRMLVDINSEVIYCDPTKNIYYKIVAFSNSYSYDKNAIILTSAPTTTEGNTTLVDSYSKTVFGIDAQDDGVFYIGEFYLDPTLENVDYKLLDYSWLVASDSIPMDTQEPIYLYGDTYYQRYDCLKTYPVADVDKNQIVDIASFMCESHMNIDGRYDRNRGLVDNTMITRTNFNLINKAYTQHDKFIEDYLSTEAVDVKRYPNTVTWTLTKVFGESIDSWTNLTSTSILDLDGDLGELVKILNFQNELIFFLEDALGIIRYNQNVAIQTSNDLPVELANSGKVDGKLYLNDVIGCQNKDTIVSSKNAVYFIDGHTKTIYLISLPQALALPLALSDNSFDVYMEALNIDNAKSFYNRDKQEIYFTFRDNSSLPCLTYSELVDAFTSFYDYTPHFLHNIKHTAYHVRNEEGVCYLWKQNIGPYNYFYLHALLDNYYSPFYMTIAANGGDALYDKIWDNVEFRSDSWDSNGVLLNETFDYLNVWNEYQSGTNYLTKYGSLVVNNLTRTSINIPSTLKKKFRIWRSNVPRAYINNSECFIQGTEKTVSNIPETSATKSISYNGVTKSRDRIRNPWAYIQLKMLNPNTNRTVLHDILAYYYQ